MNLECQHLASVSLLLDDELPDADRDRLVEHLGVCETCHKEFLDLQGLRATLTGMAVDPSARQRVFLALPQPKPAAWFSRKTVSIPWPVAAAILLLLAASAAFNAYLGLRSKPKEQVAQNNIQLAGHELERDSGGIPSAPGKVQAPRSGAASNGSAAAPGANSYVVTLQTEQESIRFITKTDYRPYRVPRIYVRNRPNSSEER